MNWDSIPLRDVLQISRVYTSIADQALYQYAKLRPYPNGLTLKGQKRGADFRGKQHQIVCAGQFVISRTHIQQHHWGIVQPELHEAITHRNTVCFDLHPDLNKNYFAAYLATSLFSKAAFRARTKQGRLDVRRFTRIELPFPSTEEQMRIAETWQYAYKALTHTSDMYRGLADMKAAVATDLFQRANSSWKIKNLGEHVTTERDVSMDYPIYITTTGKLLQNQSQVDDGVGIMPNSELDPQYLQYYLEYQKHKWYSPTANTLFGLERAIGALQIPIPTVYEQRKITSILQEHDKVLHKLKTEHSELRYLTEGMMQQIFTGTLPLQEAIALFHTL